MTEETITNLFREFEIKNFTTGNKEKPLWDRTRYKLTQNELNQLASKLLSVIQMEQGKEQVKIQMGLDRGIAKVQRVLIPMLVESRKKGIIDFKLRIDSDTHFYVSPDGKDGETVDINWGKGKF